MAAQSTLTHSTCPSYDPCNGVNISYPFWRIDDNQTPYCGYQGFGINCYAINGQEHPIIVFDRASYYVKTIIHQSTTIILVDYDVSPMGIPVQNNCPSVRPNMDLRSLPLDFSSYNVNLSFHFNCSGVPGWEPEGFDWGVYECGDEVLKTVLNGNTPDRDTIGTEFGGVLSRGFELRWRRVEDCGPCEESNGRCGYDDITAKVMCFCSDGRTTIGDCKKGINWRLKLAIGFGSAAALLLLILMSTVYCITNSSSNNCISRFKKKTEDDKSVEAIIVQNGSLSTKRYNYVDIKKMTNSFKVKLGQGGYGTVFKGKLSDGRLVAVKILNSSKASGQEFINEVASIGTTSHVNVVALLGFCFEYQKRALVYEFMPNGSLDKFIIHPDPLKMTEHIGVDKLFEIALGVARGLDYLHRGCNAYILHLDIKPHNILLDEDFCPKIADFGLAKLYSRKESIDSTLEARGTIGYIAPEVFNRNFGRVSHKSDVYSYGMLILEMVGGRQTADTGVGFSHTSEIYFPDWIYNRLKKGEILLDGVTTTEENEYVRKITIVGLWCIQANPIQRPSINEVIEMLEGNIDALRIPPKPLFSSPSRSLITTFNVSQEVSQDDYTSEKA
ncbi:hypothetical protein OSB04_014716 [Centaurea solstitialis]|uniref:non-specific serine/threonine protein kinase n=1 Tax=Centaurea solstitialis TaxID=347529 RepID=A0AA38WJF2_9ASTR|nr:hypothetical protein OSB04_014716 [Centaurea solstitialis]